MTAVDTFYSALARQNLPAAVPVETDEVEGLCATGCNVLTNEDARRVAFSTDWRDRATLAIYACRATYEAAAKDVTHF
jgi:hypothetical protein